MNKFLLTAVICTILICFMAFMAGDPPFNNSKKIIVDWFETTFSTGQAVPAPESQVS